MLNGRNHASSGGALAGKTDRQRLPHALRMLLPVTIVSMMSLAASGQEVTMRWADVVPASHPSAQMIERIAADVKAKSGGRIAIQGFPGGQLGSSRDTIEAVANGTQQVVTEGAGNFGAGCLRSASSKAPTFGATPTTLSRLWRVRWART